MGSPVVLVVLVAYTVHQATGFCLLGSEECGLEHNATAVHLAAINTTVSFTGCKCNGSIPDFEGPVTSSCLENGTWSHSLPSCMLNSTCSRPNANVNILCWNEQDGNFSHCNRTQFCVDEEIGWSCSNNSLTVATCQCGGKWSEEEVCPSSPAPDTACEVAYLEECCGSDITLVNGTSHEGAVAPNATAVFLSICDESGVASLCSESGVWVATTESKKCTLPQVVGVEMYCRTYTSWKRCDNLNKMEFHAGERIGWFCPDNVWSSTVCKCDGYWRDDVCPKQACVLADLGPCASDITLSSEPDYYGAVSPCTRAVFQSHQTECYAPANVTAVCQPGSGKWRAENLVMCSLPDIGGLDTVYCRDEVNDRWADCDKLRRKNFCSGERIGYFCQEDTWTRAECRCDGTWNKNICVAEAPAAPILPSATADQCILSGFPSPSQVPHLPSQVVIPSSPTSPSVIDDLADRTTALAVGTSVAFGVFLLFFTSMVLLVCNCLWCRYNGRKRKDHLLKQMVEYERSSAQAVEVITIGDETLPNEEFRNRAFSEPNPYSSLSTTGSPVLVMMDQDSGTVELPLESGSVWERRTTASSKHYEVDTEMREEDFDALRSEEGESPYEDPPPTEQGSMNLLKKYKAPCISNNALTLLDQLGSGAFGEVYEGKLEKSKDLVVEVAVKTVKHGPKEEQGRKALLQEAALMAQFKHPNIITMYGVCGGEQLMVVTELMHRGDLRGLLLSMRKVSDPATSENLPQLLLSFCRHIAAGMSYLSSKMFIHRDLAARNILVTGDFICKIADFGLSRLVEDEYDVYLSSGGLVAVKWAAPESITSFQYSSASDVWSFAVTMFEIWSLGYKPYHELTNTQALKKIKEGYRLPPPPGCPRYIYELMIECWHPHPDPRPQFCAIVTRLNRPDYLLLKLPQDGSKDALSLKAPLRVSQSLYADLQNQYHTK